MGFIIKMFYLKGIQIVIIAKYKYKTIGLKHRVTCLSRKNKQSEFQIAILLTL